MRRAHRVRQEPRVLTRPSPARQVRKEMPGRRAQPVLQAPMVLLARPAHRVSRASKDLLAPTVLSQVR